MKDVLSEYSTLMSTIDGIFKGSATDMLKTEDVLKFFIEAGMDNLFPNMCISVASANASFSRLKLIKNYLRSTMDQESLSGLSLISVEHKVVCNCNYDKVIEDFAAMKITRKKL